MATATTANPIRNWRAYWRYMVYKFIKWCRREYVTPCYLYAKVFHPDGTIIDLGVISRMVITTAGVNALASTATPIGINTFNYHDSGTGTNAEAIGDTGLQTPAGPARVAGTQSNPTAGTYQSVTTISYTTTQTITEHGLFSASSGGTVWDRSVFAGIGVVNGSGIQFTYTCSMVAGG